MVTRPAGPSRRGSCWQAAFPPESLEQDLSPRSVQLRPEFSSQSLGTEPRSSRRVSGAAGGGPSSQNPPPARSSKQRWTSPSVLPSLLFPLPSWLGTIPAVKDPKRRRTHLSSPGSPPHRKVQMRSPVWHGKACFPRFWGRGLGTSGALLLLTARTDPVYRGRVSLGERASSLCLSVSVQAVCL